MLGSDEDSNEDIDHIPKTPGPPAISSDRESEDEKSDKEDDEDDKEDQVKNNENDSDSDSNSSSSQSDSSNDNNRNSRNDSEVERSDNENEENDDNEEMDDNRETAKASDNEDKNEVSSDDNEDNEPKNVTESQEKDSDSDDEEVVRKVSPKKKRQLEDNSDSSDDEITNKKQRTESNDNEDNDNEDNDDNEDKDEEMVDKTAKAKDIFGDLSSEEEDEDDNKRKDSHKEDDDKDSDKESDNDNRSNQRRDDESGDEDRVRRVGDTEQTFGEDEEHVEEPIPETRIEVEIPRIVADLGSEVHFVKLPNFLSIDTHPYDPQWYEDEIDEDENLDDEGRARLKLKVENTIRWRNVVDKQTNELKKESNTRVVKWSDGTFSLHLGEEIFDIHKLQLMTGDNNHLFIRQGTGLQGQTVFRTKLNFRPFSTESFTHRKLTLSLADRSQKTQKIRVLPNVGKDPEAHRTEMIKKEEDRLKASIRRENKQRRVRERSLIRGPTASYLEPDGDEDDEEEGISLAKIKNQFKRGSFNKTYDDEESAEESNAKAANDDDDSEDDLFDKKKTEKRRPVQLVESDDE